MRLVKDVVSGLPRRLIWLTCGRVLLLSAFLAADAAVFRRGWQPVYAALGTAYLLSVAYGLWLLTRRWLVGLAACELVGDVALVTALVWLSGGPDSAFVMLYALVIVGGAVVLLLPGALVAGVASAAAYGALAASALVSGGVANAESMIYLAILRVTLLLLVSGLAGYLAVLLERKGTELDELRSFNREILAGMTSGLLTLDGAGRVLYVNPAGSQLLGYSPEELVGRCAADCLDAQQLRPENLEAIAGDNLDHEAQARTSDGGRIPIGYSASVLESNGRGARFIVMFKDLTDIKRTASELRRLDRLSVLGRMAAELAHEMKNPLASLTGAVELLRTGGERDERLLALVYREAMRLNAIVRDFLDFAQPRPLELAPADLCELVAELAESLRHHPEAKNVLVELDAPEEELVAICDKERLFQALLNIGINALEAMAGQGRLRISLRRGVHGEAVIEISDTGPGIPDVELEKIFSPFYTTKPTGVGLGLATALGIVAGHGGSITAHSRPGCGATFRVTIPVTHALPAQIA